MGTFSWQTKLEKKNALSHLKTILRSFFGSSKGTWKKQTGVGYTLFWFKLSNFVVRRVYMIKPSEKNSNNN